MITFVLASQNLPFAVSLALMLLIAILEGATTLLGAGISGFLDSLMPDLDVDIDFDMDADIDGPDFSTSTPLTRFLGWLRIGQVPVLVLLIIFLTSFGLLGLAAQSVIQQLSGRLMPALPAAAVAFAMALPTVRVCGGVIARLMPKDETEAVSENSFIGLVAVITMGKAASGSPAQAKLTDRYGQSHYVMVEPDNTDDIFNQGDEVLLVSRQSALFKAIKNTTAALKKQHNA